MKNYVMILLLLSAAEVSAMTPQEMLQGYEKLASKASAPQGQQFFTSKHGKDWSCSSCHSATPNKTTQHIVTNKSIEALAPAANAQRFTDSAKSEKWFKRNCKDVLGRECSAQEKANVIAWLLTVK